MALEPGLPAAGKEPVKATASENLSLASIPINSLECNGKDEIASKCLALRQALGGLQSGASGVGPNPEYDSTLESVTLFVPNFEDYRGRPDHPMADMRDESGMFLTQLEILKNLPSYTRVTLIGNNQAGIDELLGSVSPELKNRITAKSAAMGKADFWSQDVSEGDHRAQVFPAYSSPVRQPGRTATLSSAEERGVATTVTPVLFHGGNVFVTRDKQGQRVLLAGADAYLDTAESYKEHGVEITESQFEEILKTAFRVERVNIVGNRNSDGKLEWQSPTNFHLDTFMMPLGDGKIAIADYVSDTATAKALNREIAGMKTEMPGFDFVELSHGDSMDSETARFFTNGIVYKDRDSGQQTYLMPTPHESLLDGGPPEQREVVKELVQTNRKRLEDVGFRVVEVPEQSRGYRGSIHCLTSRL